MRTLLACVLCLVGLSAALPAAAQGALGGLGLRNRAADAPRAPDAPILCKASGYDDSDNYESRVTWTPVPGKSARSEIVSTGTAAPLNDKPPLVYAASRVQTVAGDPAQPAAIRNTVSVTIFTKDRDRFRRAVDFLQAGRVVGSAIFDVAGGGDPGSVALTLRAEVPAGVIASRQPFSIQFGGSSIGTVRLDFPPVRDVAGWAGANAPPSPFEPDGRTVKARVPRVCR